MTDKTRGESELTDEEIVALAKANHIYINAMALVRPTEKLFTEIGRDVVAMLNDSPIHGDMLGVKIGRVVYLRVNKS